MSLQLFRSPCEHLRHLSLQMADPLVKMYGLVCIVSVSHRSPMAPLAGHAGWEGLGSSCSNGQLRCRPWRRSWKLTFLSARLRLQHSSRGVVWMGFHNQSLLWSSQRWCTSHRRRWHHTIDWHGCLRRVRVEQRSRRMAEASLDAKCVHVLLSHHYEEQSVHHGQWDVQGHIQNHSPGDGLPRRYLVWDDPVVRHSRQGVLYFEKSLPCSVGWFHCFWPTRRLYVIRSKERPPITARQRARRNTNTGCRRWPITCFRESRATSIKKGTHAQQWPSTMGATAVNDDCSILSSCMHSEWRPVRLRRIWRLLLTSTHCGMLHIISSFDSIAHLFCTTAMITSIGQWTVYLNFPEHSQREKLMWMFKRQKRLNTFQEKFYVHTFLITLNFINIGNHSAVAVHASFSFLHRLSFSFSLSFLFPLILFPFLSSSNSNKFTFPYSPQRLKKPAVVLKSNHFQLKGNEDGKEGNRESNGKWNFRKNEKRLSLVLGFRYRPG